MKSGSKSPRPAIKAYLMSVVDRLVAMGDATAPSFILREHEFDRWTGHQLRALFLAVIENAPMGDLDELVERAAAQLRKSLEMFDKMNAEDQRVKISSGVGGVA